MLQWKLEQIIQYAFADTLEVPTSVPKASLEALTNCIGLDTPDSTSGNEPEAPGEAPWTEAPEIQAAPCEILQVNISTPTFYTEEILTQVRM